MRDIYSIIRYRRTTRRFVKSPIEEEKLNRVLLAAVAAPSGANKSPFRIYVVRDPKIKKNIREGAEKVERSFYTERARKVSEDFLDWTQSKGINAAKPFLTTAPILLCVVENTIHPYSFESTWIAIAYMLLAAEMEDLGTITYTPDQWDFLRKILSIPDNYSPQVILPLGYPLDPIKIDPERPNIEEKTVFI